MCSLCGMCQEKRIRFLGPKVAYDLIFLDCVVQAKPIRIGMLFPCQSNPGIEYRSHSHS